MNEGVSPGARGRETRLLLATIVVSVVVALLALHQLAGPVLFRSALSAAGEIGGMDRQRFG